MSVEVKGVGGSDPKLQSKSITSSFVYQQNVSADSGYDGLSSVYVMKNGYGYTKYSFKNITFVHDNSFYSADLKLSEGTQTSGNNIYHYNWSSDYLLILKQICAISVFVSFP